MNKHTIYMKDMWKHMNEYSQDVIMLKHNKAYWITNKYILFKCLPEYLKYEIDEATEQQRQTIVNLLNIYKDELYKCELLPLLLSGILYEGYSAQYIRVLKSDVEVTYADEKYIALFDQLEVSFYIKKTEFSWSNIHVYSDEELIAIILPIRMTIGELEPLRKFVEVIGAELSLIEKQQDKKIYQEQQQRKFKEFRTMMLKRLGYIEIPTCDDDDLPF